ncbi:MAG: hypothetical protein IH604_19695 [Burkholderiales bacterium]|nr:hypothetical protein [Burkholderiales bacterium]
MSAQAAPATPADTLANQTRDLAAQIYVQIAGRAMLPSEKAKPNPVDLAKYCYKLAEAFQSIEADKHKDALAKMAKYDVKVDDMASWKK